MTILINRAFNRVTQGSAIDGDFAESGMLSENEALSFRELVEALRFGESSNWPARGETYEWVRHQQGETRRGVQEERSVHFSRKNPPHAARYWRLAFKAAGLMTC